MYQQQQQQQQMGMGNPMMNPNMNSNMNPNMNPNMFSMQQQQQRNQPSNLIFHSDRGCQYTSYAYQRLLSNLGITQSFSRTRTPGDNSVMESFFASLKKEELYRRDYQSIKEFKDSVMNYITFYNEVRPQEFLRYISPNEKERRYKPVQS